MARFIGNPLTLGLSRRRQECVLMSAAERARHLYVVAPTRTGKSKLLEDCIRQDILAWPRSRCGMMVLDRHGSLYDNVMKWSASLNLKNWPIVPIDLRRSDWIVSYNPLRRRVNGEEEAVVVGNFVRCILHAWGQSNLNETPRLIKWLEGILLVLHTNGFTLAEALQLIVSPEVRRSLTAHIEDFVARSVWETAPTKEAQFQEMVESTVNRIRRFLSRRVMRAMLGQDHVSLDLNKALEDGQIILAAIATEGGKIDEEDASTIGSLLLSDLWLAAKSRGKRDEGQVKPFYVYLDEFQEYITPSMAETLDQASGFGLHMTFAHQFSSQLLKSDHGKQIYNSVLANCRSKIVFQLEHNEDLESLTQMLFRQNVDTRKVKHELYSTKVMGQEIKYLPSHTSGTNYSAGGSESVAHTDGRSHSRGTNWSHTDTESESFTESDGTSDSIGISYGANESETAGVNRSRSISDGTSVGQNESKNTNWSDSDGESSSESQSDGKNWGSTQGTSAGSGSNQSKTRSEMVSFGKPPRGLQPELDEYYDEELEGRDERDLKQKHSRSLAITRGDSDGESSSSGSSATESTGGSRALSKSRGSSRNHSVGGGDSQGRSLARTRNEGTADGASLARTRGASQTISGQHTDSHSESNTHGTSSADSYGGNENWGTNSADTKGTSENWSSGRSRSVSMSPVIMPIWGQELSSVTFEAIEEQLFQFAQYLAGQPDRHFVVKLVSKRPIPVVTLTVRPARTTDRWSLYWATRVIQGLRFAVPMDDALLRIAHRHRAMTDRLLAAPDEPVLTRIPLAVNSWPKPASNGEHAGQGSGSPEDARLV